jgi:hypothetical protein
VIVEHLIRGLARCAKSGFFDLDFARVFGTPAERMGRPKPPSNFSMPQFQNLLWQRLPIEQSGERASRIQKRGATPDHEQRRRSFHHRKAILAPVFITIIGPLSACAASPMT